MNEKTLCKISGPITMRVIIATIIVTIIVISTYVIFRVCGLLLFVCFMMQNHPF